MIISVASGKGGTGKTTVAVNLALSIEDAQLLDCDVEEPDAHIFLKPDIKEIKSVSSMIPLIEKDRCSFCRKCAEFCAYNALFVIGPHPEKACVSRLLPESGTGRLLIGIWYQGAKIGSQKRR